MRERATTVLVELMRTVLSTWLSDLGLTESDVLRSEKSDDICGFVFRNAHTGDKLFSVYGDTLTNHKTGEVLDFD